MYHNYRGVTEHTPIIMNVDRDGLLLYNCRKSNHEEVSMKRYQSAESRRSLARKIASEGIVLLKNNGILPLNLNNQIAVVGRGQIDTILGGAGSGSSGSTHVSNILDEIKRVGLKPVQVIEDFYLSIIDPDARKRKMAESFSGFQDLIASGAIYEIFGRYNPPEEEPEIPNDLLAEAKSSADTAICIVSRNSGGEECDRRVDDDYYLLPSEIKMIKDVTSTFKSVIVVLNIVGTIDTAWIRNYPGIKAVLYMGTPGEQGASALADILVGITTPSGKLSSTYALSYEDYPSATHFSFNKDKPESILTYEDYGLDAALNGSAGFDKSPVTVYQEGIFTGYRYFDTFGKDVMYPFGFGLSYASFTISDVNTSIVKDSLRLSFSVKNSSNEYSGKEVVQFYLSAPQGKLEQPYQKLIGFHKTDELAPGSTAGYFIDVPLTELSSYDEETARYIIEKGTYLIRVGSSSRNTRVMAKFTATEEIITAVYSNVLTINPDNKAKLNFLSNADAVPISYDGEQQEMESLASSFNLTQEYVVPHTSTPYVLPKKVAPKQGSTLADVKENKVSIFDFVAQMTDEELAVLANGYGPGLPFGGGRGEHPSTWQYEDGSDIAINTHPTGNIGYISPAIPKYGIPSASYKDGPASVGHTAWPTGSSMACTFNTALLYKFGEAVGLESEDLSVDSWLAPAVNIQRNPICGRNFEYYSEDPLLTGICATHITLGVSTTNHATVCPKHFALNEQETYRRGSIKKNYDAVDTIVEERAAREIYLKPFEMLVRSTDFYTIMSSFNKINGTFAAGNSDLCKTLLREEWCFDGVVVTDWGDMDIVVDGADAVEAGNDVIMPGGPPVIRQVLDGLKEDRCSRESLYLAAANLLGFVMKTKSYDNFSK